MGALDKAEKALERLLNTVFAKTFKGQVQPIELVAGLRNEMDAKAAVISPERILAPNLYEIWLNPQEARELRVAVPELETELVRLLQEHAQKQRYYHPPLSVKLKTKALAAGVFEISSKSLKDIVWQGRLLQGNKRYRLTGRHILGRSHTADIVLRDPAASRVHAEILWQGQQAYLRDLGSTNGLQVNGVKCKAKVLENGEVITVGQEKLVFLLEPTEGKLE